MSNIMRDTLLTLVNAYGYEKRADGSIYWGCGSWLSCGSVVCVHNVGNLVKVTYSTWWWDGGNNEGRVDEEFTLRPWELYSALCERGCLHPVQQRKRRI